MVLFFKMESVCSPWLKCSGAVLAHCNLHPLGSRDPPASASLSSWATGVRHHL